MTIAQWNTAAFGPDYRLKPLQAVNETYSWSLPAGVAPGPVTVTATVWYSKVVASVAEFLEIPPPEAEPVKMSDHSIVIAVAAPTS
jgi:hypothetical protein